MKRSLPTFVVILITAVVAIGIYNLIERLVTANKTEASSSSGTRNAKTALNLSNEFVSAANAATPAIVHIKTVYNNTSDETNPLYELYGMPPQANAPSRGSGSGVTISADGYIATNNHVIENASVIEVIFPDRRIFQAKLVGSDPSTDLALLKVNANKLPAVKMGNSDEVQVGDWVLAIGYPFSLNTTVTAGIVSAKGRTIGILNQPRRQSSYQEEGEQAPSPIESFIQTDAAINPGNSGGALVNTNGDLIGINAAIASQTGSYAGYGFAIPVNLARKILDDFKRYGEVRRGYLGITFPAPLTEEQFFRQQGINPASVKGVLITGVQPGSAGAQAGLKEGDIIQSIDGVPLSSSTEFSERIGRHRPNDKIKLTIQRNGKQQTITATLKGESSLAKNENGASLEEIYNKLGAAFAPLTAEQKQAYRLRSGIVVADVKEGGFFEQVGIVSGTIITRINGRLVNTPNDIDAIFRSAGSGRIRVDGVAPDGSQVMFTFSLGA